MAISSLKKLRARKVIKNRAKQAEYGSVWYRFCPKCNLSFLAEETKCPACGIQLQAKFRTD